MLHHITANEHNIHVLYCIMGTCTDVAKNRVVHAIYEYTEMMFCSVLTVTGTEFNVPICSV